jgi:gluconokinase
MQGSLFRNQYQHEKKHFLRATIEGILYEIYSIGKMLEEHRDIRSISVNGSFATLPLCAQILADIFDIPVRMSQNANSVSFGAFLLSATELGIYNTLSDAAKSVVLTEAIKPNKDNHDIYMKKFPLFERLSMKLSDDFEELAEVERNFPCRYLFDQKKHRSYVFF